MCSVEKVGAVSSSSRAVAIRVYPELRRAPTCCADELLQFLLGATSVNPMGFILLALTKEGSGVEGQSDSHSDRSHALPLPANCAKLNRQTAEVVLTGSGSQTEIAVTRSKQSTASFLTGSRIPQFGSRMTQRDACWRSAAIVFLSAILALGTWAQTSPPAKSQTPPFRDVVVEGPPMLLAVPPITLNPADAADFLDQYFAQHMDA